MTVWSSTMAEVTSVSVTSETRSTNCQNSHNRVFVFLWLPAGVLFQWCSNSCVASDVCNRRYHNQQLLLTWIVSDCERHFRRDLQFYRSFLFGSLFGYSIIMSSYIDTLLNILGLVTVGIACIVFGDYLDCRVTMTLFSSEFALQGVCTRSSHDVTYHGKRGAFYG